MIARSGLATSLRGVGPLARDLVPVMTAGDPADISVDVHAVVPERAARHWLRSAELHAESARLRAEAAAEASYAARCLRLTVRNIAAVLDIPTSAPTGYGKVGDRTTGEPGTRAGEEATSPAPGRPSGAAGVRAIVLSGPQPCPAFTGLTFDGLALPPRDAGTT